MMKKFFTTLTLAAMVILSACSGGNNTVNKNELQGRYQIDLAPVLKDIMEQSGNSIDIPAGFASMLDVTVQFETEKAIVDASGVAIQLFKSMTGDEWTLPMALGYKIENDSVLYLKQEGKDFEEVGVLKKIGDGYDYLKVVTTKNGKRTEFGMKKIK